MTAETIIGYIDYLQHSREEMDVLFTLLAEVYERDTVMLTSKLPLSKRETIFNNPTTAVFDAFYANDPPFPSLMILFSTQGKRNPCGCSSLLRHDNIAKAISGVAVILPFT